MRNTNCRNVRRDIEEAGNIDFLSAQAHAHIQTCEPCATLAGKQSSLSSLMSSLGNVEAPGDFDFRLRARLAAERQGVGPVATGNFSFGFRFAAVAMTLVAAAALMLVGYRSSINYQVDPSPVASNPETPAPINPAEKASTTAVAIDTTAVSTEVNSGHRETPKRREVASWRGNRVATRDVSSTQAAVLKRYDELTDTHSGESFPINASYQSLKVSVDNGHGGSRTISLPTVSFGSQRTVSQNPTPLMASARGVW